MGNNKKLKDWLNEGLAGTNNIFFFARNDDLEDIDNLVIDLDPTFVSFVQHAPTIRINKNGVVAIQIDKFAEMEKKFADQLKEKLSEIENLKKEQEKQNNLNTKQAKQITDQEKRIKDLETDQENLKTTQTTRINELEATQKTRRSEDARRRNRYHEIFSELEVWFLWLFHYYLSWYVTIYTN